MEFRKVYKRPRRTVVELTSLLDLLFVMIFVSLIQQKEITPVAVTETKVEEVKEVKTLFNLSANFNFYSTSQSPGLPSGSYIMQGNYDSTTGRLQLGGVGWIERPKDYDMVPLSGTIDESQNVFTGQIEAIGCETFTLERVNKLSTTPVSGEWKGTYSCSQGMTGLTLTIK